MDIHSFIHSFIRGNRTTMCLSQETFLYVKIKKKKGKQFQRLRMSRRPFNLQFSLHVIGLFRTSVWLMCRPVWFWSNQGYVVKVMCWPVVPTQRSRASFSSINWFPPTLSFSLGKQVKTQMRYKDRQKPIFIILLLWATESYMNTNISGTVLVLSHEAFLSFAVFFL